MKIKFYCPYCEFERPFNPENVVEKELVNLNYYQLECRRDHTSHILLNQEKYEMLFEVGCLAYLDGYYREAVTSIASALENFREFCIDFFVTSNEVPLAEFKTAWKDTHLSERQLGAYNMLYLNYFKEAPIPIPSRWTTFRNKATHSGEIPSPEKALEYAEFVYEYINSVITKIKQINEEHLMNRYFNRKTEQIESMELQREDFTTFDLLTIMSLAVSGEENLESAMNLLVDYRDEYYTK